MQQPEYEVRLATPDDISAITTLILAQGPNPWNHLPEEEVRAHVESIATGTVSAVVADTYGAIIGVVTYEIGHRYPDDQPLERAAELHGYAAEAVVHSGYAGRGIGTELLKAAIERLTRADLQEIYAMRHEENIPSRRMMEKCGMEEVRTFDDPKIRPTGSRRTTVMRIIVESKKL